MGFDDEDGDERDGDDCDVVVAVVDGPSEIEPRWNVAGWRVMRHVTTSDYY